MEYKLTDESKEIFKEELKSIIEKHLDKLIDWLEFEIDERQLEESEEKEELKGGSKTDFYDGMIIRVRNSQELLGLISKLRKYGYKWNSELVSNGVGRKITENGLHRIVDNPDYAIWILTEKTDVKTLTYYWYNEEDMDYKDLDFISDNEEAGLLYDYDSIVFPELESEYLNGRYKVIGLYAGEDGYVSPYTHLYDEFEVKDGRFTLKGKYTFPIGGEPLKTFEELEEYLTNTKSDMESRRRFSNCQIIVEEVKNR